MPDQAGGGPRFRNAGSQWKSSWKGKVPFSEMFCISGFSNAVGANWYEDAAVLPGNTTTGFFIGAVVGLKALPVGADTIAHSGDVNEGWTLDMLTTGGNVVFRFTVYDGAGIAAQVVSTQVSLANVDTGAGEPDTLFVSVLAGIGPAATNLPFGAVFVVVAGSTAPTDPVTTILDAAYVNTNPALLVGVDEASDPFATPNCIHGIVGGVAPWVVTNQVLIAEVFDAWDALNQDSATAPTQIQPVPDAATPIGVVNTNGWRSPTIVGDAPDPLPPFIGATNLTYGMDPTFPLTVNSHSPVYFWPANVLFPFPPP